VDLHAPSPLIGVALHASSRVRDELLEAALEAGPVRKVLRSECLLTPPPDQGMTGSGMLVVNPPWGLEQRLHAMLADPVVTAATGIRHQYDWLVPE
jgi:23S rRNA (adenine2030-N6)-methyltransferase